MLVTAARCKIGIFPTLNPQLGAFSTDDVNGWRGVFPIDTEYVLLNLVVQHERFRTNSLVGEDFKQDAVCSRPSIVTRLTPDFSASTTLLTLGSIPLAMTPSSQAVGLDQREGRYSSGSSGLSKPGTSDR